MTTQPMSATGLLLLLLQLLVGSVVSLDEEVRDLQVSLSHLSTVYLPTYTQDGAVDYSLYSGTVEQLAVHAQTKVIYAVGDGVIHIIDASDVSNLTPKDHLKVEGLELTDVEVCDNVVVIPYRNHSNKLKGGVLVYSAYNLQSDQLQLLQDIPMGTLPDMVLSTSNCTLVVALENEGFVQGGQFYDLPGGVGIIRFPSGIDAEPEVKVLNFTKFDSRFEQLAASGVRWVYRGSGNNFSNNVEPEFVAFNHDYSMAYVALQPDSIVWVRWGDQDYLITANEGDAQEYPAPVLFAEEIRGKDIADSEFAESVSADLRRALQDDTKLGRLTLSRIDGKNSEGKFERFYTYGGRGISIWRTSDMSQVFDSGSEMEKKHAQHRPDIFNSNLVGHKRLRDTVDTRSDNKGPETESLATGLVDGHLLIFAGNERPGTIAVYSVAPGNMAPKFQTLYTGVVPQGNRTWQQMYEDRELHAMDPESIEFLPVSEGLADFPLLLVAGTVSGTVSVLRVDVVRPSDGPSSTASSLDSCGVVMVGVLVWVLSLYERLR